MDLKLHPIYDEKINCRSFEIKIDGKLIKTPNKTVEKIFPSGEINEFAPIFTNDKIKQDLSGDYGLDSNGYRKKSNSISGPVLNSKRVVGALNVMIPTYADITIGPDEMSKMETLQHTHSDVMVVPRWEGLLKSGKTDYVDRIMEITKSYIECTSKDKIIFGNIPRTLSFNDISRMMDMYYELDVTSFVIDCCNRGYRTNLDVQRDIQKKLKKDNYLDNSILYSINVKRTTTRSVDVIPADDFLMFGFGMDIIGNMHIAPKGGDPEFKSARHFKSDTYTYEKKDGLTQYDVDLMRAENEVIQNNEAKIIREKIIECGTSYKLLNTKDGAKVSLESMLRESRQRNLDSLF
jgi:hypothetical protein